MKNDDHMIQKLFAQRIGGNLFGKEDKIYKFEKIKRAKRAAQAQFPHVKLIDMGVGEPDEPASPITVEVLKREAGKPENRFYTDNGILAFKQAAARYMKRIYGVELDPVTQINHSIGTKSALALLPACFINPGDITLMTIPGYPVLGTWTQYLGGEVYPLPLEEKRGYFPDFQKIPQEICKRAKLLYLNYPNNPTGATISEEKWREAIDFCRKHQILLVSDAAYGPLVYQGFPQSVLKIEGALDCAVELHSMSKGFNMTGWRLGWICGNELAVKAFATVKDNADSGQFAAIQLASAETLDRSLEITPKICVKYERRLKKLVNLLNQLGFSAKMPGGTFYLYVPIPKGTQEGERFNSAEQFSDWLIRRHLISTVPWDDVGAYVRFSATFEAANEEVEDEIYREIEARLARTPFIF